MILCEVGFVAEKDFHVTLPQEVVGGFGWRESEVPSRVREALVMELLATGQTVGSAGRSHPESGPLGSRATDGPL